MDCKHASDRTYPGNGTSFDNTTQHDAGQEMWSDTQHVIILVLCSLALLLNVVSIAATMNVVCIGNTRMRLVVSLAVCNLCMTIVMLFWNMLPLTTTCLKTVLTLSFWLIYVITIFNLLAIAMDINIALLYPQQYSKTMVNAKGTFLIGSYWVFGLILVSCHVFTAISQYNRLLERGESKGICQILLDNYEIQMYVRAVIAVLCFFTVCIIVATVFYDAHNGTKTKGGHRHPPKDTRYFHTAIFIIMTYFILSIPYCLVEIIRHLELFDDINYLMEYIKLLQIVYCILVPTTYFARHRSVRKGYKTLFHSFDRCVYVSSPKHTGQESISLKTYATK